MFEEIQTCFFIKGNPCNFNVLIRSNKKETISCANSSIFVRIGLSFSSLKFPIDNKDTNA